MTGGPPAPRPADADRLAPVEQPAPVEGLAPVEQPSPDAGESLLDAFRRNVARAPGHTALIVGEARLTYADLDAAAAGLARRFTRLGAGPGRVVCVRTAPGPLSVIAVLAALRTAAAWVAIEPDLPAGRLRTLLRDTDCAVLLSEEEPPSPAETEPGPAPGGPPPARIDPADLDVESLIAEGAAADTAPAAARPGAPAYLIYTSGSTGTPKGVVVAADRLADSVAHRSRVYGSDPSVCLMAMRLSFDGMLGGMFWSFCNGHTLVVPEEDELRQAARLARLAVRHRATHLIVVPSYYRALLECGTALPRSLRQVVVAGEVCPPELVATHQAQLPDARLANEYGPTETVVSCTVEEVPDAADERIPIGRPWPGALTHVLDSRLRPVPDGERGELYVGGAFVALGYAARPALTAERFVPDPFGAPGSRMYRTGDLASRDVRGALHYHGRTDHQVKIRGARVELGEIEAVLERHPGVGQAVVVHEAGSGQELTAFCTPKGPARTLPGGRELRRHCRRDLVEQAVPGQFVAVERMPLNSSGKADRAALRARLARNAASPLPPRPGWSGTEQRVAAVWAAVLGHHDVERDDNFFAVGGSSLRIIDLYTMLAAEWPGAVRLGELFDLITIAAQAEAITARTGGAGPLAEHAADEDPSHPVEPPASDGGREEPPASGGPGERAPGGPASAPGGPEQALAEDSPAPGGAPTAAAPSPTDHATTAVYEL